MWRHCKAAEVVRCQGARQRHGEDAACRSQSANIRKAPKHVHHKTSQAKPRRKEKKEEKKAAAAAPTNGEKDGANKRTSATARGQRCGWGAAANSCIGVWPNSAICCDTASRSTASRIEPTSTAPACMRMHEQGGHRRAPRREETVEAEERARGEKAGGQVVDCDGGKKWL